MAQPDERLKSLDQLMAEQSNDKKMHAIASGMITTLAAEMGQGDPSRKSIVDAALLMATISVATVQAMAGSKTAEALLKTLGEFAGRRQ